MRTQILEGARKQKVIVERRETPAVEWWVMFHTGDVQLFDTPGAALKAIRKAAKKGNRTVTLTNIEWRGVPDGWKPPTE